MKIQEMMKTDLRTVTVDCTLKEAAAIMQEVGTGVLPVVEGTMDKPGTRAIGVLTDRDIVIRCISEGKDPNTATVDQAYTADTIFCEPEDSEKDVFDKMRAENVGRILVKGKGDELAGIVSLADIIEHVPQHVWDNIESSASNTNRKNKKEAS